MKDNKPIIQQVTPTKKPKEFARNFLQMFDLQKVQNGLEELDPKTYMKVYIDLIKFVDETQSRNFEIEKKYDAEKGDKDKNKLNITDSTIIIDFFDDDDDDNEVEDNENEQTKNNENEE